MSIPALTSLLRSSTFFGVSADFILGTRNVEKTATELRHLREIILLTGLNGSDLGKFSAMSSDGTATPLENIVEILTAITGARDGGPPNA